MQCVILAGGLGTRMRPLTDTLPKTLLPVRGRPFAWYQLDWLARHGVTEVVYCIGHQGDKIRRYWATHPSPVTSLRFVDEGEQLRGTAGALRLALAEGVLDESFFVLYGDSFLPIDFAPIWSAFESGSAPAGRAQALMTVLRNEGRWDSSNVVYSNGLVALYDKRTTHPEMIYVDYGLSVFRRTVIEQSTATDLSSVFHQLSLAGDLAGYEVTERFYEIGSPQGLRDLENLLPSLP
jgi:NDP-sugar pyrophosphorylase family protein